MEGPAPRLTSWNTERPKASNNWTRIGPASVSDNVIVNRPLFTVGWISIGALLVELARIPVLRRVVDPEHPCGVVTSTDTAALPGGVKHTPSAPTTGCPA